MSTDNPPASAARVEKEKAPAPETFWQTTFRVVKVTVVEFFNDNCLVLAGAVAYSALQSVIPLILGFIAVGSLFLQDPSNRTTFVAEISAAIPSQLNNTKILDLNKIIEDFIKSAGAVSFISIIVLLWTGSGVFGQLKFAVNVAFDVEKDQRNIVYQIALQLIMLIVLGGLLILSVAISFISSLILNAKFSFFGISPYNFNFMLPVISYLLPIVLVALVFAFLYKLSPARKGVRWKPVLFAGALTSLLFELLKFLFGLYLSIFQAADNSIKTYGAIGGLFVFLFFLYLTAAVILFGAELASALHNFESGLAHAKASQAIVETPAVEIEGELVPEALAERLKNTTGITPQPVDENGKPRPKVPKPVSSPGQRDLVTTLIGGAVVIVVAALEMILQPRPKR